MLWSRSNRAQGRSRAWAGMQGTGAGAPRRTQGTASAWVLGGDTQGERRVPGRHAHTATRDARTRPRACAHASTRACRPTRVCRLAHGLCCQPPPGEGARSWLRDPGEEGTAQGTGDVGQGTCSPIAPSPPGKPRARQGTARWSPRSPKRHRPLVTRRQTGSHLHVVQHDQGSVDTAHRLVGWRGGKDTPLAPRAGDGCSHPAPGITTPKPQAPGSSSFGRAGSVPPLSPLSQRHPFLLSRSLS